MVIRKIKTKRKEAAKEIVSKESLSPKVANKLEKAPLPKVTPTEKSAEVIQNPEVKTDLNLVIIKHIKEKMKEGHFSIGVIAKEFNVSFQKVRYLCYAIAKKEGKSMIKTGRREWIIE